MVATPNKKTPNIEPILKANIVWRLDLDLSLKGISINFQLKKAMAKVTIIRKILISLLK